MAADEIGVPYNECVVFEDSEAGIQAAKTAKMKAIGLGNPEVLSQADAVYDNFHQIIKDNI